MRRKTMALRILPGMMDEFRHRLQAEKPGMKGVRNASIWRAADLALCYSEVDDDVPLDAEKTMVSSFLDTLAGCCECLGSPVNNPMRLMYEDIGVVRQDKANIRHRVFITRLKPGCAEEYKRRHDALVASRGGRVNPGPESNFTIWNAGEYIFGYCELDRTMEREPTEESRKATVAWETRMLEIMDWITDDVDWLTGLKHDKIELVCRQG